ncbi:Uncharacterized protein Fot_09064 [Forsythia ovata]|uniref:Uncharacterized protein n=1 Tax=Forsythia ovata TaxID=205694 RepID=A0ABD1WCZ1_9LAMI
MSAESPDDDVVSVEEELGGGGERKAATPRNRVERSSLMPAKGLLEEEDTGSKAEPIELKATNYNKNILAAYNYRLQCCQCQLLTRKNTQAEKAHCYNWSKFDGMPQLHCEKEKYVFLPIVAFEVPLLSFGKLPPV